MNDSGDRRDPADVRAEDARRIESYLAGDPDTFDEIESWIRRQINTRFPVLRSDVEDLCQETHARLLVELEAGRFRYRSRLRTYVAGIANYTAIGRIRERYRERESPGAPENPRAEPAGNPYRSLEALEERQLLHQVVQRSPAMCRALWGMIFIEKLSYADVGRRLSIPPGTVKSRVWHCRRKALALLDRLRRAGGTKTPPKR